MIIRMLLVTGLIALGLTAARPTQAKELVLQPSSPWNLDYAEDSCALRRRFGEGDQATTMELRRFAPDNHFQTMVATSAAKVSGELFMYRLDPDKKWRYPSSWHYLDFEGDQHGVVFGFALVDVPMTGLSAKAFVAHDQELASQGFLDKEAEAADRVSGIRLRYAFPGDLVLATGSLKAPLMAMRTCIDELRTHWGIDVDAHKTLTRPAVPINRASVPNMMAYPPKMLAQRVPGLVNIRLDIDDKGRITDCHIQMPLADPTFAASSCADLQHALDFEPALDKDGKPIASYWVTGVDFRPD